MCLFDLVVCSFLLLQRFFVVRRVFHFTCVCDCVCCYSWLPYTVKCFVICIKDRMPDRHSCLNLHPCVIKFSQSVSQSLSLSLMQTRSNVFYIYYSWNAVLFTADESPKTICFHSVLLRRNWRFTFVKMAHIAAHVNAEIILVVTV